MILSSIVSTLNFNPQLRTQTDEREPEIGQIRNTSDNITIYFPSFRKYYMQFVFFLIQIKVKADVLLTKQ